jgi:hypothetical protein
MRIVMPMPRVNAVMRARMPSRTRVIGHVRLMKLGLRGGLMAGCIRG